MNKVNYKPSKDMLRLLTFRGHERDFDIFARVPELGICEVAEILNLVVEYDVDTGRYYDMVDCSVRVPGERLLRSVRLYPSEFCRRVGSHYYFRGEQVSLGEGFCCGGADAVITDLFPYRHSFRVHVTNGVWYYDFRDYTVWCGFVSPVAR